MMLFPWKSKADLRARIKSGERIVFQRHAIETSLFGPEYHGAGDYAVCLDHPKRTKFATLVVDDAGFITGAR